MPLLSSQLAQVTVAPHRKRPVRSWRHGWRQWIAALAGSSIVHVTVLAVAAVWTATLPAIMFHGQQRQRASVELSLEFSTDPTDPPAVRTEADPLPVTIGPTQANVDTRKFVEQASRLERQATESIERDNVSEALAEPLDEELPTHDPLLIDVESDLLSPSRTLERAPMAFPEPVPRKPATRPATRRPPPLPATTDLEPVVNSSETGPSSSREVRQQTDRPRSLSPPPRSRSSESQADRLGPPTFVRTPLATYPVQARRNRWEGVVLVRLKIDRAGRVTRAQVVRSSGFPILDAAAIQSVKMWQARPTTVDGKTIERVWDQPIRFRL